MKGWTEFGNTKRVYYSICPCGHIMLGWPEGSYQKVGKRYEQKFTCPECDTHRRKFKRTWKLLDVEKFIDIFIREHPYTYKSGD